MTYPTVLDLRRGIKNWQGLGNVIEGDCTVAAYEHVNMVHNLATSSWWKRLAYQAGYRPPTNQYALDEYAAFLSTLGERPSPTTGVDPNAFLTWEQNQGRITEWESYDFNSNALQSANKNDVIRQVTSDWTGCLIGLELTNRAYRIGNGPGAWTLDAGDTPNPHLAHAVAGVGYGLDNIIIVTWGVAKQMSNDFAAACVFELWAWR